MGEGHKGFGISTAAMLMGLVVFAGGLPLYRIHVVKGSSAITEIVQVWEMFLSISYSNDSSYIVILPV